MNRFSSRIAAVVAFAAISVLSTAAQALPVFTSGSFAAFVGIHNTASTNVLTATSYATSTSIFTGNPVGSFAAAPLPLILASPANLTKATPSTFDFSQPATIGTFTATSVSIVTHSGIGNASATWTVTGTFLLGADWQNHGQTINATETWTFSQTGGPGKAVSANLTYFAAGGTRIPEPLTLSLFGGGLVGAAALYRRKRRAKH